MDAMKRIADICEILNGFAFKSNEYAETGIRIIRITNVQKGEVIDNDPKFFPIERQSEILKYLLRENDLLISLTGNVGRVGLLAKDMIPAALNQRVACLRIKTEDVLIGYLFHILNSNHFEDDCISNATGIAQKNMSTKWLAEYTISVPERAEQERIVGELDCLSGIIAAKRAQLRELDTLAQSIFYTMFGDPYSSIYKSETLSNLSKFKLSYGSCASAVKYNNEVRYIRITDIGEDGSLSDNIVSPNVVDDKYILQDGDLLFARSGATVGKTYLYDSKIGKSIYAGYLIRFIANKDIILPKYLYYYTKTGYYKDFIKNNIQAVAQPNINAQQYSKLKIVVPPIALQNEFVEKIEHIEEQKQLIKASIAETENLFNGRMSYYFE